MVGLAQAAYNTPYLVWTFDDSDTSGTALTGHGTSGINGVRYDALTGQTGIHNEAYKFDGTNDFVNSSTYIGISGANTRTIILWYKMVGHVSLGNFVGWGMSASAKSYQFSEGTTTGVMRIETNGDDLVTSALNINDGNWHQIGIKYNGTTSVTFYHNGLVVSSQNFGSARNTMDSAISVGTRSYDMGADLNGYIDELYIYNDEITDAEVLILNSTFYPFTIAKQITLYSPSNYSHQNTPLALFYNTTGGFDNCTLWGNFSGTWSANASNTTIGTSNSFYIGLPPDGKYIWNVNCFNVTGSWAVRNYTLFVDTSNPTITLLGNNSIALANSTKISNHVSNLTLGIDFFDAIGLYQYEVNISNSSGATLFYNGSLLSGKNHTYSSVVNISQWVLGNYRAHIEVSDSHTLTSISNYEVIKSKDTLMYLTDEKIAVTLASPGATATDSAKQKDRYNFMFEYPSASTIRNYRLTSSNRLDYQASSKYPGHFVIWNPVTHSGNWIDFAGEDISKIAVKKINDFEYNITITYKSATATTIYNSIGGLNVVAEDILFNITSFVSLNVTHSETGVGLNYTASLGSQTVTGLNGLANFTNVTAGNYTLHVSGEGISNVTQSLIVSQQFHNISITTLPTNSVTLFIKDATTLNTIASNTSIIISATNYSSTYYTDTGTKYIEGLPTGLVSLLFNVLDSNLGYSARTYSLTISNASTLELTAYLSGNTSNVIFTMIDQDGGQIISDVSSTMYSYVNSTWTTIESKNSDITGRVQFTYLPNTRYQFLLTKAGYENRLFELNPILFSSYDIPLVPLSSVNSSMQYDRVSIAYTQELVTLGTNNFTFIIASSWGELEAYSYNLSYPGGSIAASGTNAIGERFEDNYTLAGVTEPSTIRIDYFYTLTNGATHNFSYSYGVTPVVYNHTMMRTVKNPTYGLGILERALIITVISFLIIGVSSLAGKLTAGVFVALAVLCIFVYVGFISIYLVFFCAAAALLLLSLRGEQA